MLRSIATLLLCSVVLLLVATATASSVSVDGHKKTFLGRKFASKIKGRLQDGGTNRKPARKRVDDQNKGEDPGTEEFPELPHLPDSLVVSVPAAALILLVVAGLFNGKPEEEQARPPPPRQQQARRAEEADAAELIVKSISSLDLTVATENDTDADSSSDDNGSLSSSSGAEEEELG